MATSGRSRKRGKRIPDDQYSVTARFMVPPRFRAAITKAADAAGVCDSEWMRQACDEKLVRSTDHLASEKSRLLAELNELERADAEMQSAEAERAEKAKLVALERQRQRPVEFDKGVEEAHASISLSKPARVVLKEAGLEAMLDIDPGLLERIPDGPLKDAASRYLED